MSNAPMNIPTRPGRLPIVAIDGPAGAGKSTLASRLASRFGLLNLETGAMYRAFALKAIAAKIGPDDDSALQQLAATTSIRLEPAATGNVVYLDGVDVTPDLRNTAITEAASRVSVHPAIRAWMVSLQQRLGEQGGVVMEGRDIGTAVFPDADIKIFLDAAPETRSLRRYQQGDTAMQTQPESVLREMKERDERDRNRAQSPLRAAADAVVIDSTHLTLEEVVAQAEAIIAERLAARSLPAVL